MDADAIVVGAGLAGLRCAARLKELGHEVVVLEAGDDVGGRVRTDVIDGFRCDRGFQVLNPAYPAVRRWVDVDRLDLKPFGAGVLVRTDAGLRTLADPVREPRLLAATLRSGLVRPMEVAALARWAGRVVLDPKGVLHGPDSTLSASLDAAGVDGRLRREVLEPFLAGVLVDSHGGSSAAFTKLLVRMFLLGRPGVPATGMAALPRQLAQPLGDAIRFGERVEAIEVETIRTVGPSGAMGTPDLDTQAGADVVADPRDGALGASPTAHGVGRASGVAVHSSSGRLRARAVVVATDPVTAAALTSIPRPDTRGLVTWWFDAAEAPTDQPLIAVDGRRGGASTPGPVWNTAVLSNAAPSYAAPTRHLVEATTLLDRPDGDAPEGDVLAHLGAIWGHDTSGWRVVTRHRVEVALPATPPPLEARSTVSLGNGVFVCGDHRDTPSIQGALVSGQRAAEAVHASL